MSNTPLFRGAAVALITPFKDGKVDFDALRNLVEMQIEGGTAAIVTCGTTGEPATLTTEERIAVVTETVKAVNGRIPVICGTGSNNTAAVIENEKRFRDLGCAAQLVVTPYYNKTTQEGLYAHFMAIADNTELPIILYNVPSRTSVDLGAGVISRLKPSGRFIALKESSYTVPSVMEKLEAMGDDICLYSGNDDMVYPLLALGAEGVISVVSNVAPRLMADMVNAWFDGNARESLSLQMKAMPLVRALFREVSPIPCKYAAEKMGLCSGELRLPLVTASPAVQAEMDAALLGLGLIK